MDQKTGSLIAKKRKELNLTQEQLSELLSCTPQAISLWEKGLRYPYPEAQIKIHEVLIPKNGDEAAKHVKYTDYFNVESPVDKPAEEIVPKEDYDPGKLYLNHGHCIFSISVLKQLGSKINNCADANT